MEEHGPRRVVALALPAVDLRSGVDRPTSVGVEWSLGAASVGLGQR